MQQQSQSTLSIWLMALMAPMIWGTTYSVTQRWLVGVDPFWLAALRISIPGCLMVWMVPKSVWIQFGWRIALLSMLNIAIFTSLLFIAIGRLPGGIAATLVATLPLQVIMIRAIFGIRPEMHHVFAAIGGVVGVACLVWQSTESLDSWGVVAALSASFIMACGILLTARWIKDIPPLQFTSAQLFISGVVLLLYVILSGREVPDITPSGMLALAWLGPIGMGMGYWLWFRAMKAIPIQRLSFLGLVNPVVAVLVGVFFMSEEISTGQLFGMCLVLLCVVVGQRK
ncbi:DMT family transporter [Thalassolituus oleivorans]|uniref:Transporter permease protein, partial n=1 Tax=Thalassolituus oleivorans MIL-1 TaxID=1298593 RepID=M5DS59_9GAMM|nr:EamA family transporter [Thalassolituus oleivorans]CCU72771.1 transporter permease protein [Thalassolituus oleivorans MIL-1]